LLENRILNEELKVEVLDYNNTNIEKFEKQKSENDPPNLFFKLPLNWSKIDKISFLSQKNKLIELGFVIDQPSKNNHKIQNSNKNISNENTQEVREEKLSVTVLPNNAQFKSGRVTFNGRLNGIDDELFFDVKNVHILEKFDFIKSWFVRKLKISKWKVDIIISRVGNKIIVNKATSKDVDRITPELIEGIKYDRTVNLIKNPSVEDSNQELFSVDEIFSQIDKEKKEKNTFEQSEKDILNILLKRNGRNRKQLEYLSEEKQSLEHSLKFTLNPHFGFLFTVEGKEDNHFVWELLETHATYIWSINKSVNEIGNQIKKVENAISIISKFGRDEYRKNYQKNDAFTFSHINHNKIITKQDEHFVLWKDKLNEYLS
jgi:hypothetical protein